MLPTRLFGSMRNATVAISDIKIAVRAQKTGKSRRNLCGVLLHRATVSV